MIEKAKEWSSRLNTAQAGHYMTCEKYMLTNKIIGYPLVILSSFVSAFLFFQSSEYQEQTYIILKTFGILVAILASLQTFMRPAEMAEVHRIKATKYGSLKRKIEQFSINSRTEDEWEKFSKEIVTEWNAIAEDSPVTPHRIRKKISRIISEEPHNVVKGNSHS